MKKRLMPFLFTTLLLYGCSIETNKPIPTPISGTQSSSIIEPSVTPSDKPSSNESSIGSTTNLTSTLTNAPSSSINGDSNDLYVLTINDYLKMATLGSDDIKKVYNDAYIEKGSDKDIIKFDNQDTLVEKYGSNTLIKRNNEEDIYLYYIGSSPDNNKYLVFYRTKEIINGYLQYTMNVYTVDESFMVIGQSPVSTIAFWPDIAWIDNDTAFLYMNSDNYPIYIYANGKLINAKPDIDVNSLVEFKNNNDEVKIISGKFQINCQYKYPLQINNIIKPTIFEEPYEHLLANENISYLEGEHCLFIQADFKAIKGGYWYNDGESVNVRDQVYMDIARLTYKCKYSEGKWTIEKQSFEILPERNNDTFKLISINELSLNGYNFSSYLPDVAKLNNIKCEDILVLGNTELSSPFGDYAQSIRIFGDNEARTNRDIGIGSTKEDVISAYGIPDVGYFDNMWTYYATDGLSEGSVYFEDLYIQMLFKDNLVKEIKISDTWRD